MRACAQVFRQRDEEFLDILDAVRQGEDVKPALDKLSTICSRPLTLQNGIEPTHLFATNSSVARINEDRLARLQPPAALLLRALDVEIPDRKANEGDRKQLSNVRSPPHALLSVATCVATPPCAGASCAPADPAAPLGRYRPPACAPGPMPARQPSTSRS